MKLDANFAISSRNILFYALLTVFTLFSFSDSTLVITAQITVGVDVTISEVDGVLSVPINAGLELNCSSPDSDTIDWRTTSSISPLYIPRTGYTLALISSFVTSNTGGYTCSVGGGESRYIFVNTDDVSILPNPQYYHAYESEVVTLSLCVSAYPSLKSDLSVTWTHQGLELSSCATQGVISCLQCQVAASDSATLLNYTVVATTSQGHSSSELLFITVHQSPAVESPLPPTTPLFQCRNLTLMCTGIGDQFLTVEWRHTPPNAATVVLTSTANFLIETESAFNTHDGQYYTRSGLTIGPADLSLEGRYTCSFIGYRERRSSTSTLLDVIPQLCLHRRISVDETQSIPGSSIQVLDEGQGTHTFLCYGDNVSWYQNEVPVSYIATDVYQSIVPGGLYVSRLSQPDYFYCKSGTSSLQSWIFLTGRHPTVITRPSGALYQLMGGRVSIHAYLSHPRGPYSLDWFYLVDGEKRNVTEFGWSINQLSEEAVDYFEVSISLSSLQQSHSGLIGVDYNVGGQLASSQVSLFLLQPPELVLSPTDSLKVWEGSHVEVECRLKNDSLSVATSPQWTSVATCTSQTEVCADGSTLLFNNISTSATGSYLCSTNETEQSSTSLQVQVHPFSQQLVLLSVRISNTTPSYTVQNTVNTLHLNTSEGTILLSCSLDSSIYSTQYLNISANWGYSSSYAQAVSRNGSLLSINTHTLLSSNQSSPFSFCCLAELDSYRRALKCLQIRSNITITPSPSSTPTPTPTSPSTLTTHIVLFLLVDNCTLLPSPDPLTPVRLALLAATRTQCSCNISDTELHLTHHTCHTDLISNSPQHLLTLCGASTHSLYRLLISDSLAKLNFSLGNHSLVVSSVTDTHTNTHCDTSPHPTNASTPLPPATSGKLPVWTQVLLYGAFPVLLLVLIIVVALILSYICYNLFYRNAVKSRSFTVRDESPEMTDFPDALQTLVQSDRHLSSTQVTLSPSQVPHTFKTAAHTTYHPDTPPPQELISRPSSSPPPQGEFPVMYSNPLAFDGSGEVYSSSSFTNFNNNRNYSSDMPPISETAARFPAYITHRVSLNQLPAAASSLAVAAAIRRDHAHSSLPSPLRSARRYSTQRRLSQLRNRPLNYPYTHHQLKLRHPPPPSAKISRYGTPTFDSGVEEMESTHPRSSSASSYSEVSDEPPTQIRASSLATSFPQHVTHIRVHSAELARNTSLPNITETSPASCTKLELYRTVKQEQTSSQTLV